MVRLDGLEARRPAQLSGGQQQRVALARALVLEPPVLLLDEPLGALDARLRVDLQVELKRIQEALGITFVYVTHDQDEALTMSDRVAVMRAGRIEQCGDAAGALRGAGDRVRGQLPRRVEPDPGEPSAPAALPRSAASCCGARAPRRRRRGDGDDPARARAAGAAGGRRREPGAGHGRGDRLPRLPPAGARAPRHRRAGPRGRAQRRGEPGVPAGRRGRRAPARAEPARARRRRRRRTRRGRAAGGPARHDRPGSGAPPPARRPDLLAARSIGIAGSS